MLTNKDVSFSNLEQRVAKILLPFYVWPINASFRVSIDVLYIRVPDDFGLNHNKHVYLGQFWIVNRTV